MGYVYALINKSSLKYIREQKGVSCNFVTQAIKVPIEKLNYWEDSTHESLPTINQAKKIARCLKVPFAGLYMNPEDIPIKKPPKLHNMRTIQTATSDDSSVNLAVIDLIQTRESLLQMSAELNFKIPAFTLQVMSNDPVAWASRIREYFELSICEQYNTNSSRQFYLYLRRKIEDKGIFVQCFTGVNVELLRGLAIPQNILPIIGINDDDRYPAKSFTIIHELVHVVKRHSAICNELFNAFSSRQEEIFCNAVAGELLVPKAELDAMLRMQADGSISMQKIEILSKKFSVSKEVIVRRLFDNDIIDRSLYLSFAQQIKEAFENERQKLREQSAQEGAFPMRRNMPRETIDKYSTRLCLTLLHGYSEGVLLKQDLSRYLGLDQKHINAFLVEVSKWR